MISSLYDVRIVHQRFSPKPHRLEVPVFMFYFDLDELGDVERNIYFFSRNRFNLYSFRDEDHFKGNPKPLREKVLDYLKANGIAQDIGKITLLTSARVMGYVFNPVSFYFCFSPDGRPLAAIAEVSNTFGEMKPYFIPPSENGFHLRAKKHFYVSPFMDLDLDFDFDLRTPGGTLEIYVDDLKGEERVLTSSMKGGRHALENARLIWYTLTYPLVTLKVIILIHWHALLLWIKGIGYHAKDDRQDMQKDILNPRQKK